MEGHEEELKLLQGMTPAERQLRFIGQEGLTETRRLKALIAEVQLSREDETWMRAMVQKRFRNYNEYKLEDDVVAIEQYSAIIVSIGEERRQLMADIKATRERVRWLRVEYKRKMQLNS